MIFSLLIILFVLILSIKSYRTGFVFVFLCQIILPTHAVFSGINLNIVLLAALFFAHVFFIKGKKDPFPKGIGKILALYFFLTFVLMFFAKEMSIMSQLNWFIKKSVKMFALGYLGWFAFKDITEIRKFISFLLLFFSILGLYGVFEYVFKVNPIADISNVIWGEYEMEADADYYINEARGMLSGRIKGTTVHPLTWGQVFLIAFSFFILFQKFYKFSISTLLIFALILLNIFLTGSRSALVPTAFVIMVAFLQLKGKTKFFSISLLLFGFLCVFLLLPNTIPIQEIISTFKGFIVFWDDSSGSEIGGSSLLMRENQFLYSLQMLSENLFTGLGVGYLTTLTIGSEELNNLLGVESIMFVILIEQGILGIIIFLLLYTQLFFCTKKEERKVLKKKHLISSLAACFIAYLVAITMTGDRGVFSVFFSFLILYMKYLKLNQLENKNKIWKQQE